MLILVMLIQLSLISVAPAADRSCHAVMLILGLNCYFPTAVAVDDTSIYIVCFCSCCVAFEREENLPVPSLKRA
jgi:hypothetical protein